MVLVVRMQQWCGCGPDADLWCWCWRTQYWCILFFVTMRRQIQHMIKYRYLPFTTGKKVSSSSSIGGGPWEHCASVVRRPPPTRGPPFAHA